MAGSNSVTSFSDKKAKVPKKLLSQEEKSVQAAKRWGRRAILKLKQKQQEVDEAISVAAATLALQIMASAIAYVRLPPTMAMAMLNIKQERIADNDLPAPQASSVSSVSFQAWPPILPAATPSVGMQVHASSYFAASGSSHSMAAPDLDLNRTPDMDSGPAPLRKTQAVMVESMPVPCNLYEEMTMNDLTMDDPIRSLSHTHVSFIVHLHHLTPGDS
jgi:hypothetical protein